MFGWLSLIFAVTVLSFVALVIYLRRSARVSDCVLLAHGLILLVGLLLAGLGVIVLKILYV